MSRHAARPAKKQPFVANTPDKQAATALDHRQRGRFRDAIECYKALLKTESRPEWLAGLASSYEGRAKALAAKEMRREAIAMWRSRAEVCHQPLWEGPYAGWLIAEGQLADVLGYMSRCRAAASATPQNTSDALLAYLEAQLAPALLSADAAICAQLPADSLLAKHRPLALAALLAYCAQDALALGVALAGISFRSPYRDLRSVLKALVLWESDVEAARAAIDRVPQGGPFEPLAAPLRSVVMDSSPERWRCFASLTSQQQLIALDLQGYRHDWAPMLLGLAGAGHDLAPSALFDQMQRNARLLPERLATDVWQWLAPWAKRNGCASPLVFGKPSKAHQECATALAVEIKGEREHAEEHWLDAVQLLERSADTRDRLRAAMVLRHMASMKEHLSREGTLDKAGAGHLLRSLEFDASDCDVHVQMVGNFRRQGDLKKARERLDAGLALFPTSAALLSEAVETALAAGAFKKAVSTAHRLLELDPLNRKIRSLLGNAHLSHAGKHITADRLESAKKEIEEARSWLGAANEIARLHLLQAWTEPPGSSERLRLTHQAVTAWGGGLAAGWRLVCEAQALFARVDINSAKWLLDEAGIDSTKTLTPADVLALVQVLEQEPHIVLRKGADPLVAWRKALVTLAPAPLFDDETTLRICEAMSRHKEHDLLERFAGAARERWPDRPVFVYHAVAARFGKAGEIASKRDFDDLERAQDRARKSKDFKLGARIEALFEADDPEPDLDDSDRMDGPLSMPAQAFREMLEMSVQMDGGKLFLQNARNQLGDELVREVEKSCAGNKKLFLSRIIDLVVMDLTGTPREPLPLAVPNAKEPRPSQSKIVISAPDKGQGSLFDE